MNNSKKNKENTDNIKFFKNQNEIFDKIIECILKDQINDRGDLKLFGITQPQLQKEVLWTLFEQKVVSTKNKKEKHRLINKFHRANLL
tara:strand:+ start:841 stop:1104 length:264 start_codon:yes stop_codon:yes gene_type:complete